MFSDSSIFAFPIDATDTSDDLSSTESDSDTSNSASISNSDTSPPSFSSITPDSQTEDTIAEESDGAFTPLSTSTSISQVNTDELDPTSSTQHSFTSPPGFTIIGDNIDKNVRPRYMRSTIHRVRSLHYFHSYAVFDRVNVSHLSQLKISSCLPSPAMIAKSLLPSNLNDAAMKQNIAIHISRVLTEFLPFFKASFSDVVKKHIQHKYYPQMSKKSHIVSY